MKKRTRSKERNNMKQSRRKSRTNSRTRYSHVQDYSDMQNRSDAHYEQYTDDDDEERLSKLVGPAGGGGGGGTYTESFGTKVIRCLLYSAAVFVVVALLVGGLALLVLAFSQETWEPPQFWDTCSAALKGTGHAYVWSELAHVPCSDQTRNTALCTYANDKVSCWCGGNYYETSDLSNYGYYNWTQLGADGSPMNAIWEDSHYCYDYYNIDDGWQDLCIEDGGDDADLQQAACFLNQWALYVDCGGWEYRYKHGVWTHAVNLYQEEVDDEYVDDEYVDDEYADEEYESDEYESDDDESDDDEPDNDEPEDDEPDDDEPDEGDDEGDDDEPDEGDDEGA